MRLRPVFLQNGHLFQVGWYWVSVKELEKKNSRPTIVLNLVGEVNSYASFISVEIFWPQWDRACFKENSSLHISNAKVGLQIFYPKISIYPAKFPNDFFVTAQTAFHHCTFRFITAHFVHHCTLKQALLFGENRGGNSRFWVNDSYFPRSLKHFRNFQKQGGNASLPQRDGRPYPRDLLPLTLYLSNIKI